MSEGQRPGEADRAYLRRLAADSRRQQQIARDGARQDALNQQAYREREERADAASDQDADEFFREFTGTSLGAIQKRAASGGFDKDPTVQKAIKDAAKALSKSTKGGRRRALKKVTTGGSGKALKRAGKKTKSGCAVAAVMMLGALGGAAWALYQGIATLTA